MSEFFSTPAGIAVFTLLAVVVVVFIIEVNYKYHSKSVLDFIFALIASIILSPVYLVLAIVGRSQLKKRGGGKLFKRTPYVGYKGEIVELYSYSLYSFSGEYLGGYADFLKKSHFVNIPRLLNILELKLSFVGIKPLASRDGSFIGDEDLPRFNAKIGLISPVIMKGNDSLTYEQMFELERRYVNRREFFYDIGVVIVFLFRLIRGDKSNRLGEAATSDYCEVLLKRGEITEEQLTIAEKEAV